MTIRCVGELPASVEDVSFFIAIDLGSDEAETSLMGRNDFPAINPALPARLRSVDSLTWLTNLLTARLLVTQIDARAAAGLSAFAFRVTARQGSGETVSSDRYAISDLPFELL